MKLLQRESALGRVFGCEEKTPIYDVRLGIVTRLNSPFLAEAGKAVRLCQGGFAPG
jgi:hypothetical protein